MTQMTQMPCKTASARVLGQSGLGYQVLPEFATCHTIMARSRTRQILTLLIQRPQDLIPLSALGRTPSNHLRLTVKA